MSDSWDEIAHTAFNGTNNEPITADATNVTKFGAPAVAIVTALVTALLGASWSLDPKSPAVLFAGAIIVAAVVLGVYLAFASDIGTRGAVTVARFQAVERLARHEAASKASAAKDKQLLANATAAKTASDNELADTKRELEAAKAAVNASNGRDAPSDTDISKAIQDLTTLLAKLRGNR